MRVLSIDVKQRDMINDSILIQFLSGELDSKQRKEVLLWLDSDQANVKSLEKLKSHYEYENSDIDQEELNQEWKKLEALMANIQVKDKSENKKSVSWILRAAAVIILAVGTTLIFNLQDREYTIRGTNIDPVATVLPDGSKVYLTKGSRLNYSQEFNKTIRQVNISGEAFFKVTGDPEKPFIVITGDAKIKVTGTSFNVSAPLREDDIEVVVKSGKVLFYNSETFSENSFKVGLGPGEKGIYSQKLKQLNKTRDEDYKYSYNNYN